MASLPSCVASQVDGNVGLAFGIVTASGLSTTIGAALAFVMPYSRSSKNLFLAACLAIAAGVMIYVSFVEIFTIKAVQEFQKCFSEEDANYAYLYATLCFFGGIAFTAVFDKVLHVCQHLLEKRKATKNKDRVNSDDGSPDSNPSSSEDDVSTEQVAVQDIEQGGTAHESEESAEIVAKVLPHGEPVEIDHVVGHGGHLIASIYNQNSKTHDSAALIRMGIFAGMALAFHVRGASHYIVYLLLCAYNWKTQNFPEGLATFVAVLEDPSVGASVAIAIAIHNIPEGVCVAMPIYYATGSRFKAFMWATLSGMTELVGAALGWVVLRSVITPMVYAVLFGVVGGMMVYISFKELIPTAHRYDPDDQVTSIGIVAGMLVMAASLVLFQF